MPGIWHRTSSATTTCVELDGIAVMRILEGDVVARADTPD
jgi:hypothetical protein